MRVANFIKEQKITLNEFNKLCEFLFLSKMNPNTRLSEILVNLFKETLISKDYKEWFLLKYHKFSFEDIEIAHSLKLISYLRFNTETVITEILGLRIINSLTYLIEKNKFSEENKELIENVLKSEKSVELIISKLRASSLAKIPNKTNQSEEYLDESLSRQAYKSNIDPYENCHWGDLSGEEAYAAYWNCE